MTDPMVGDAIFSVRLVRRLSRRQLGALTDPPLHPARIFKIEHGLTRIRPHELQAIVAALDMSVLYELLARGQEGERHV